MTLSCCPDTEASKSCIKVSLRRHEYNGIILTITQQRQLLKDCSHILYECEHTLAISTLLSWPISSKDVQSLLFGNDLSAIRNKFKAGI
jgi:hypothetical protein